jgi:DNA-binding NarL/FixJ family response regulator
MSDPPCILLIDGNQEDREYYAPRIQESFPGYIVIQAETGLAGLTFFEQHSVDCVILELDLPDMSGFEVLTRLVPRVRHPKVAVIVLTFLRNEYLLTLALQNGAQAALHKRLASGDILHKTILKAIATVQPDRKRDDSE